MIRAKYSRKRLLLYLVPILIGLGGVRFSQEIDDLALRGIVTLLSVSVPIFAGGNLLARYSTGRIERFFLFAGVLMLILGAVASITGVPNRIVEEVLPPEVASLSQMLGLFSLLLGLFVVLFSVIRTREDIEEIGDRFWHLAEHITEGFILSRADGTIILINKQFLKMSGLAEEQVLGHNASELADQFGLGHMQEHLENRGRGVASEYEVTWRVNGEERRFWFSGTPILDHSGRHTATLATVRDITEHHRLTQRVERYAQGLQRLVEEQTQKLARSEEQLRQLLLSMNEGFLTIDARNRIRFANDRIQNMLGLPPEGILDHEIFEFVDGAGRVALLNLLAKGAMLKGTEPRREVTLIDAHGNPVPTVVAVAHIPEARERDPVYSLVVTNVAELKRMQHELEQRAAELERANEELRLHDRAKDSFLSNVSHELRTPLSTIQGYVEMLESGSLGALSAPQSGAIKVMGRNVNRLIGHINEIIEFSRMEIRGVQIHTALLSPSRLVEEAAASIHPHTLAKDLTVSISVAEPCLHAWGDREKLGQVLGILLNNAVKFTEKGGMIQVRVGCRGERTLTIAVSDTGVGIDSMYHEQIFTKFFQVDSSMTRRYEGTGIGLSIAKSIVEAHGGHFEVTSAVGAGSTFTIVLPGAIFETRETPAVEGIAHLRLIVADEYGGLPEAVAQSLGAAGVTVRAAANTAQCLRLAEESPPDVLLVDDSVLSEEGIHAVEEFRRHPEVAAVPIVVCAGARLLWRREAGAGLRDVLLMIKPFDAVELARHLRAAHLGDSRLAAAPAAAPAASEPHGPSVLVIDPDREFQEWIETALERRRMPCFCAENPSQAMALIAQEPPGVILMDVDGFGERALENLAIVRREFLTKETPIYLMTGLSARDIDGNGIAGVLRKPFSIEDLLELIGGRQAGAPG